MGGDCGSLVYEAGPAALACEKRACMGVCSVGRAADPDARGTGLRVGPAPRAAGFCSPETGCVGGGSLGTEDPASLLYAGERVIGYASGPPTCACTSHETLELLVFCLVGGAAAAAAEPDIGVALALLRAGGMDDGEATRAGR